MSKPYAPPFTITSSIVTLVAQVSEAVGRLSAVEAESEALRLRRINRIRTILGSLAIEFMDDLQCGIRGPVKGPDKGPVGYATDRIGN